MPKAITIRRLALLATLLLSLGASICRSEADEPPPVNKLLQMYNFYYLPFGISWREGKTKNDIIPLLPVESGDGARLLKVDELDHLDKEWNQIKESWKKRSLLLSTPVGINQTVKISQRLFSHRVALSRGPFDGISITDQIQLNDALRNKSPEVQAAFKQLRFLKSFVQPGEEDRFNFFMVSASWCDSCKEYRVLMETYLKMFPNPGLVLHSLVIDDPKEEIFDSKILKDLFPHPKRYSHESIPRFLAVETVNGKTTIWEEGEALEELYERFYKPYHGFLNNKVSIFRGLNLPTPALTPLPQLPSPQLSSITR